MLLSGGEPLLNPQWIEIAETLRAAGLEAVAAELRLSLAKHARRAAALFDTITVSGWHNRDTYTAIRGLGCLRQGGEGIRAAAQAGARVTVRVTLQHANFRELPKFVELARAWRRAGVVLAVDVANPHAFGREADFTSDLAPAPRNWPNSRSCSRPSNASTRRDFRRGFIAESPGKLRRLLRYFAAVRGVAATRRCAATRRSTPP